MDPRITYFRGRQKEDQAERAAYYGDRFEDKITKVMDINYLNDGNSRHTLDVFSPKNAVGLLPVIVELHGGGYITNEKDVTSFHAKYFASNGFLVVNGDYTLCPEADFAQELQEISDIFSWIYKNREKYPFDTDRIYLTGDSAGGHLVLLYAMLQGNKKMQEFFGVTMPPVNVKAAAPVCPAFQFRINPEKPMTEGMNVFFDLVFPNGASDELLDMLDITVLAKTSAFPPLHIVIAPQDDLLYELDLELIKVLKETDREVDVDICVPKTHELPHVFNVLLLDWEESIEANGKIMEFFLKH